MLKNIFTTKRQRISRKVWLRLNELLPIFKKTIWITSCAMHAEAVVLLGKRIKTLINRSGWKLTFLYLKESLRIVIRFLAGQDHTITPNGVCIRLDHTGLPTIIPLSLRKILRNRDLINDRLVIVCILTCLSVFRVFPVKAKVSLDTIVSPFTGINTTLDKEVLRLALKDLLVQPLVIKSPKPLKLETSGPNSIKSTWAASVDAIAFLYDLKAFRAFILYNGFNWVTIWCCLLCIIGSPFTLILWLSGEFKDLYLGRLGVVYDQAGKARVIAITNWWIQVSLKPLHDAVFRILKRLEMSDGTFNQDGVLDKFMSKKRFGSITFHSFDLSAATDRIPLALQRDILDILVPGLGSRWSNLLDISWFYRGQYIKYSVGQPMGAYSSWAMLALTHHVIVRCASMRAGIRNFDDYLILGDDIVIANSIVAKNYLDIMKYLGVQINLSKSVESTLFCEFAKRWVGPTINITPIGPGLLLRLVRDTKYLAVFVREAWQLKLISNFRNLLDMIAEFRSSKSTRSEANNVLWSSFGLSNFTESSKSPINVNTLMWCFSAQVNYLPVLRYHIYNALLQLRIDDKREATKTFLAEREFFYRNWWKTFSTKNAPHRILEFLLKVWGPGFWVYAIDFINREADLAKSTLLNVDPTWSVIQKMAREDVSINVSSIDWTQKRLVQKQASRYKKLWNEIERSRNETPELFEEFIHY